MIELQNGPTANSWADVIAECVIKDNFKSAEVLGIAKMAFNLAASQANNAERALTDHLNAMLDRSDALYKTDRRSSK